MIVTSSRSVTTGDEEGVNGASPSPGTVNSTNWPALNGIGLSGRMKKVLILCVSVTMSSIFARMGRYGLGLQLMERLLQNFPYVNFSRARLNAAPAPVTGIGLEHCREEIELFIKSVLQPFGAVLAGVGAAGDPCEIPVQA